ncbi:MAG: hypothetical protein H6728_10705 [Myxococcales bacterium]|nr:hypothetical protein [Myxococcales bacterium]
MRNPKLRKMWLLAPFLVMWCSCFPLAPDICRLEPEKCHGSPGALCNGDNECAGGLFCCLEKSNCGGGMCTLACEVDTDCPTNMLCEHKKCFFRCESDQDCAPTMRCEHGNTICEYP